MRQRALEHASLDGCRGSTHEIQSIVVLRPNHRLGNTLLLTPLIDLLARCFPQARVDVLTSGRAGAMVFSGFANIRDVFTLPSHSAREPLAAWQTLSALRRRQYDLAIDPIPYSKSGRLLLAKVNASARIGYQWCSWLYDRPLTAGISTRDLPRSYAEIPIHLLRSLLDPCTQDREPTRLELHLSDAERRSGIAMLPSTGLPGPTLGVFAHATGAKCYGRAWWSAVLEDVHRAMPDLPVVEFVPGDNRPRLEGLGNPVFGCQLRPLAAALASTNLLVTADCGIMHLADAAGTPVLGLFKATNPERYGPRNAQSTWMWATDADPASVAARIIGRLKCGHRTHTPVRTVATDGAINALPQPI